MNILLVTREFPPNVVGGMAYHSYNLARNLADMGNNVKVITSEGSSYERDNSGFNLSGIEIEKINYRNLPAPRLWFNRAVINYFRQNDYSEFDVLHSHEFVDFGKINFEGEEILKIHFNLVEKNKYNQATEIPSKLRPLAKFTADQTIWRAERKLERKSLQNSDKRIYNSSLSRKIYEQRYSFNDEANVVIHNGVDTEKFTLEPQKNEGDYLIFLGGSSERKGADILLDAYKELDDPIKCKIVGNINSQKFRSEAETFKNIELVGRKDQDKLINLYQGAKALIHPSRYEPFGNVILESLACGTTVTVSSKKYCGAAEILDENVSQIIEPKVESLKKAIKEAETREVESKKCRKVAKGYTWKKVAEETMDFFG